MKVQDILGSPLGLMLGMFIGRTIPRRHGYRLARRIARWMRRNRYDMFRTLRDNLSHVVPQSDGLALDELAEEAVFQAGCSYFDMFHFRTRDLVSRDILRCDPGDWETATRLFADERGTILAGAHMSNYDLAAQWFVAQGYELHALSLAKPDRGDRIVNMLRRRHGIRVTPISLHALREALMRLRRGGLVITGVDRPVDPDEDQTMFFDAPAPMPRGHVRLALQTDARVIAVYCLRQPDGRYRVYMSPPIEMERTGNRQADIEHNTRRVLVVIEEFIRSAPEQWVMLTPVWPKPGEAP